jgi:hypothetical protein
VRDRENIASQTLEEATVLLALALELFKCKAEFPVGKNNSSDKSHLGIECRYGNVEGEELETL